jgi:glucose-fructose oxidoreductase
LVIRYNTKASFAENVNFFEVTFKKGMLNVAPYQAYAGVRAKTPQGEIYNNYQIHCQLAKQMDDDAESIMQDMPMLVAREKGLRDIRILEAIYKSAASAERGSV